MIYNVQIDPSWKDETMSLPGDTLGMYGCLVTSLANVFQEIMGKIFTPRDLNDIIKDIKGYAGLRYPDSTPFERASFLLWDVLEKYFETTIKIEKRINPNNYVESKKYYYICRISTSIGNHYVNVLSKNGRKFKCFDVYSGKIKEHDIGKIHFLHRVEKIFKRCSY